MHKYITETSKLNNDMWQMTVTFLDVSIFSQFHLLQSAKTLSLPENKIVEIKKKL